MISHNSSRSSLSQSSRLQFQKQNLILSELIYHDKLIRRQQGLNRKRQQSKPLFQTYMENLTDISPKYDPYSDSPLQEEKVQLRKTPLPKTLPSLARCSSSSSSGFLLPIDLITTKSEAAISFNSNSATKSTESALSSSRPSSSNPPKIRQPIFQNLVLKKSEIKVIDNYVESTLSTPA